MRDIPEKVAFVTWAPPASPWSPWVKPVLFAHMDNFGVGSQVFVPESRYQRLKKLQDDHFDTALVVNLPGVTAIAAGLALADMEYRPIPLYNVAPASKAIHKLDPMIHALEGGTEVLREKALSSDALPAFLLDADRTNGPSNPGPGTFDNRWVVFPQDFPSGGFLLRHRISRVVLIQEQQTPWQEDLCHVLYRWQEAGIGIEKLEIDATSDVKPVKVPRPSFFRSLYYRWLTRLRYRRNTAGGFGGWVPQPSEGGGGYAGFG